MTPHAAYAASSTATRRATSPPPCVTTSTTVTAMTVIPMLHHACDAQTHARRTTYPPCFPYCYITAICLTTHGLAICHVRSALVWSCVGWAGMLWVHSWASMLQAAAPDTSHSQQASAVAYLDEKEKAIQSEALAGLPTLYSHPFVTVLQLTEFPTDYPEGRDADGKPQWDLPTASHVSTFFNRGWCWTETLWVSWSGKRPLDLHRFARHRGEPHRDHRTFIRLSQSAEIPLTPLTPAEYKTELQKRTLCAAATYAAEDTHALTMPIPSPTCLSRPRASLRALQELPVAASVCGVHAISLYLRVCVDVRAARSSLGLLAAPHDPHRLNAKEDEPFLIATYGKAYQAHFSLARRLDFSEAGWGEEEIMQFCRALSNGVATRLEWLYLVDNNINDVGMEQLAELVKSGVLPRCKAIALDGNPGDATSVLSELITRAEKMNRK